MLSYSCGITDKPLIYKTIGMALTDAVKAHPDREALVICQEDLRYTYTQLADCVERAAGNLLKLGIQPGDRVGIWSPNNREWVITQLATAKIGAILVTINPAYRTAELEYVINKVRCSALILAESFKSSNYIEMLNSLAPELKSSEPGALQAKRLPGLGKVIVIGNSAVAGTFSFASLEVPLDRQAREAMHNVEAGLQADDPINIQFTSGTTGFPKGATLSHFNILNNGYFVTEKMRFSASDRLCLPVPLYHCFGMVMGVLGCITHGAAVVLPGEAFDPLAVLSAVAREKCTALYGVPTMFIAELAHPAFADFDLGSLRTGIMAGTTCPAEIMESVMEKMHMPEITIAYGMTETSPVSFQTSVDDPIHKRVTSVGRVHPHVQVKIIDKNGRTVPCGTRGELCTRGYSVMRGYWDDNAKTRESIDAAGWMHTGDLAIMDDAGYCDIVGRVKDIIIRGGENIYPREVEEYLLQHPAIQDAAVFGVPDKKFGEQVAAWIQLAEGRSITAKEVLTYCDNQIAHYKIPHYIRFVDEFPMTVTGKIQKFIMREKMCDELSLPV